MARQPSCSAARLYLRPAQTQVNKDESNEHTQKDKVTVLYRDCNVQISQDKKHFYLSLDLPGVPRDSIQLDLHDDGILRMDAKRNSKTVTKQFSLGETTMDTTGIQANLVDGVLDITVPKKEPEVVAEEPVAIAVTPNRLEEHDSKKIVYTVDIPGVTPENVKVTFLQQDKLFLQTERNKRGEETVCRTRRCLRVDTKKLDTTQLQAFLADGVLTIVAPERLVPPPIRIVIGTTSRPADETSTAETFINEEVEIAKADKVAASQEASIAAETVTSEEATADEEAGGSESSSHDEWQEVDDARKEK